MPAIIKICWIRYHLDNCCLYNPTGLLLLNIEILWKFKYFLTNWYVVWTKKYVIFQLTIVQLHLMSNLMVRCIVPCHYVENSNIEMPLKYAPIKVRVRPRFFDQVGHQTNNASIGNMVFCYHNCSNVLWEKIVLVWGKKLRKKFANSRP